MCLVANVPSPRQEELLCPGLLVLTSDFPRSPARVTVAGVTEGPALTTGTAPWLAMISAYPNIG